jgi:histone acetyltransferase
MSCVNLILPFANVIADFRTMEEKLSSNQYETMEMFIADAQLVFDNCLSFNPPGTAYHTSASKMAKWFKAQIANRPKKEET